MTIFGQADSLSEFLDIEDYEPDCTCEEGIDPACYWHGEGDEGEEEETI